MIPGSGRCAGEGIGYPLQYSWASLVAQLVKNPLAMRETWVRSLGWEDPLEKGKATTPVFQPGEFHGLYSPWGHKESDSFTHRAPLTCLERVSSALHFHQYSVLVHDIVGMAGDGSFAGLLSTLNPWFCGSLFPQEFAQHLALRVWWPVCAGSFDMNEACFTKNHLGTASLKFCLMFIRF